MNNLALDKSVTSSTEPVESLAEKLFEAPFVVVSHGTEADPIFNYGNRQALALWELDWQSFTRMPSRQSATPAERAARAKFLAEAKREGCTQNYRGIRTSSTGKQFWIENVILWNVLDEQQHLCGQAAMFDQWQFADGLLKGDFKVD